MAGAPALAEGRGWGRGWHAGDSGGRRAEVLVMRLVVDVLGSDVGRLVEGGGGTLEGAGGGAAVGLLVVDKGDAVGEVVARGLALAHAHRVVDLPQASEHGHRA